MFSENLLDSSMRVPHVRRWPMATAFMLEAVAGAAAVLLPLISNSVIPMLAHDSVTPPLRSVPIAERASHTSSRSASRSTETVAVQLARHSSALSIGHARSNANQGSAIAPGPVDAPDGILNDFMNGSYAPPRPPAPEPRRIVSVLSEAQLLKKVEPVYPHIAVVAGISGTVKLHAIIGTDGSIQDLSVAAGHPLLVQAALDAVRQRRYKPYLLNGRAIEVETFITVVFRKPGE